MSRFRENKHKQLTSHKLATMFMRASLTACTAKTIGLGVVVDWPIRAFP
jgi:hypothetical protein